MFYVAVAGSILYGRVDGFFSNATWVLFLIESCSCIGNLFIQSQYLIWVDTVRNRGCIQMKELEYFCSCISHNSRQG